jgi:hypothetical protein
MATYTIKSTVVGSTGASGLNGYTGLVGTQNTAVATAITTAMAVTGFTPNTLSVSPAVVNQDANGGTIYMTQTLTYVVTS